MKKPVSIIKTAPDLHPGSMRAYGDLVRQALAEAGSAHYLGETISFYNPAGGPSMWSQHWWRIRNASNVLFAGDSGLMHLLDGSMAAFMPRSVWSRLLVTVHDLIPLLQWRRKLPGPGPSWPARAIIDRTLQVLRACRGICVDSDCTRQDLERFTGRTDASVIPLAARLIPLKGQPSPRARRFIMHIGNNATYKNRSGVIEVFRRLVMSYGHKDLDLIMAGPAPSAVLTSLAGGISNLHFLPDVEDEALAELYKSAELLLFPSLYEGFGMPVLEAMAAGCPVVCSDTPALAELAGDAACMAASGDIDRLASLCDRIIRDTEWRSQMIERGKARARAYTLIRMGHQLRDWYDRNQ